MACFPIFFTPDAMSFLIHLTPAAKGILKKPLEALFLSIPNPFCLHGFLDGVVAYPSSSSGSFTPERGASLKFWVSLGVPTGANEATEIDFFSLVKGILGSGFITWQRAEFWPQVGLPVAKSADPHGTSQERYGNV